MVSFHSLKRRGQSEASNGVPHWDATLPADFMHELSEQEACQSEEIPNKAATTR